ncbi:MAG: hypothetical protein WD711_11280 [Dongiaceae bacterium]
MHETTLFRRLLDFALWLSPDLMRLVCTPAVTVELESRCKVDVNPFTVIAGLDPAIHLAESLSMAIEPDSSVFSIRSLNVPWIAGSSPAMTPSGWMCRANSHEVDLHAPRPCPAMDRRINSGDDTEWVDVSCKLT